MFKYLFDFFTVSGKEPLQINRIKFAFQFFLVFCFLFSFFPSELLETIKVLFSKTFVASFIIQNQNLILVFESVFLLFQAFTVAVFGLSLKTHAYPALYQRMCEILTYVQFIFLLIMQTVFNLGIISFNILSLLEGFLAGAIIDKIYGLIYCADICLGCLLLLGFFYQKD